MTYNHQLYRIVSQICQQKKIKLVSYGKKWILKLTKNKYSFFIWGFQFPIDDGTIRLICDDKAAQSEILRKQGILCFEHNYFFSNPIDFTEPKLLLKKYKKIVCKPNNGTGGKNVEIISNYSTLKSCIKSIAGKTGRFCLSPFYEYNAEYRVILLNKKALLFYEKKRPTVIGDGKNKIKNLIKKNKMFDVVVDQSIKLNSIPKKNETILLNWRHNLAFGAKPVIVKNPILIKKLKNITKDVLKVINIKFCAIDIADVNHKLMVVEINNGIMFEKFSKSSKKNFTITKNVYLKAINYILQHKQHTSC